MRVWTGFIWPIGGFLWTR